MRFLRQIIEILFWALAAGAAMFAAAMIAGFLFAPVIGYLGAMAVIGLVPLTLSLVRLIRRRRAAVIISYLEQAVRLNLPLPRMLRAAALSERGTVALRLAQLRSMLEEGYPLWNAVDGAVPEVSDRDVSIIAAAERVGRLASALRRLVREQAQAVTIENDRSGDAGFFRTYPLVMLVSIGSAVSLFSIFVLPKYEQILKDFGTKMPGVTQLTLDLVRDIGLPLAALVVLYVLMTSGRSLEQLIHSGGRTRRPIFRTIRDYVAWATPFWHGLERDKGLADAFDVIADALAVGTPLNRAVAEASALKVNAVLSRKLHSWWQQELDAGVSPADAARNAGLPPFVAGMLAQIATTASAEEVFRFLSRYYRSRFSRTAIALRAAGVPLMVLGFGVVVALVALAIFMPMTTMIQTLSVHAGRWML
jgi:type IV pilus assembly protein PilC